MYAPADMMAPREGHDPRRLDAGPARPAPGPVVVAGAGPAGCAAAIALRRAGKRVVLLDRARFPRDKVCGDVLLPSAIDSLRDLGLDASGLRKLAAACAGARYRAPSGRSFEGEFRDRRGGPAPWLVVRRAVLDAWLLAAAREAGAEVIEEAAVRGVVRDAGGIARGVRVRAGGAIGPASDPAPGERVIDASGVIGADGASSATARSLGVEWKRSRDLCAAVRGYTTGDPASSFVEIFTTRRALPGCAWLIPVDRETCNIGAGIVLRDARARSIRPARLLEEFIGEVPALADRLRGHRIGSVRGWTLPLAVSRRRRCGGGWLLAGDAAGLIDPLTGHGIHTAIESGRLAGETLAGALEAGDVSAERLGRYDMAVRERLLRGALAGRLIQRLHATTLFAEAMAACARSVAVKTALVALIGHGVPRAEILLSAVRRRDRGHDMVAAS